MNDHGALHNRTVEERAQDLDKLDRELTKSLEEQPQRDRDAYRTQRWMELPLILFSWTFGPGLFWAGKDGIRWPCLTGLRRLR